MLSDVIAAIQTDFAAENVTLTDAIAIGNEQPNRHGAPPRIVIRPTRDTFGPPHRVGGQQRSIRTRSCGAEAHIWGTDVANTEALLNQFVLSMHRVIHGEYTAAGGEWMNGEAYERKGFGYKFTFTVNIPIVDTPYVDVAGLIGPDQIGFTHTGTMHFPDGQDVDACGS